MLREGGQSNFSYFKNVLLALSKTQNFQTQQQETKWLLATTAP